MTLYLELNMGAAGDMIMGALYELLPDRELFLRRMQGLGLPGVEITAGPSVKCGVTGTKMRVIVRGEEEIYSEDAHEHKHEHEHEHEHDTGHSHYGYPDVRGIIEKLDLSENVRAEALEVYRLLGEAEAAVHGATLEDIRFHELGAMDAVADIVGCCLLFYMLGAERVEASPVHVGSGFIRCAHGTMPVPSPATASILKDVPIYGGKIRGELCTPTGAAILKHFVRRFGDMEPMAVSKIGYGMGTKDFEAPNCVRAFLSGRTEPKDRVAEIACNLDDMTPEAVGYAVSLLLERGALDVFTAPIYMKKNRPAVMLTCLCRPDDRVEMTRLILENTTTFGVRYRTELRDILDVDSYAVATPYGDIRIKSASGHGLVKEKPEYEDVRAAAAAYGVPFSQVWSAAYAKMKTNQI